MIIDQKQREGQEMQKSLFVQIGGNTAQTGSFSKFTAFYISGKGVLTNTNIQRAKIRRVEKRRH